MAIISIPVNSPQEIYLTWVYGDSVEIDVTTNYAITYTLTSFIARNLVQRKKVINITSGFDITGKTIRISIPKEATYPPGKYTVNLKVSDINNLYKTYYTGILEIKEE
jgi:hypothetical protein